MKPDEFVLWLNGAAELVGDQPPTPEQWATMREKLGEAVGGLVAARLLERAEEALRADERRKKEEVVKNESLKQALELMKSQHAARLSTGLAGFQARVDAYAQSAHGLADALPAGTILELPEPPKPSNPGLLNRIFGKATT